MKRSRVNTTVDANYAAYDEHPIDEPDEWGDLASWRQAAAATGETSGRLTLGSHAPLSPGGTP